MHHSLVSMGEHLVRELSQMDTVITKGAPAEENYLWCSLTDFNSCDS